MTGTTIPRRATQTLVAGFSRLHKHLTAWERPPAAPLAHAKSAAATPATSTETALRRIEPGAVVRTDGQHTALFEVNGLPLAMRDAQAAEAFLSDLAGLLNALRTRRVQMVARSRPGGFTLHLGERKQTANALALPSARTLGLAQVRHYERMAANGDARALAFYLVVPAGNRRELEAAAPVLVTGFRQIGLVLRRVQEPELSLVLGEWWRGTLPTHWYYRLGDVAINVAPHNAKVTR